MRMSDIGFDCRRLTGLLPGPLLLVFKSLIRFKPGRFLQCGQQQRQRLQNPAYTAEQLLNIFYNLGLPLTVNKLRDVIDLL